MFSKLKQSLSRINYKLYFALLVLGLAPTIYTTVGVFFFAVAAYGRNKSPSRRRGGARLAYGKP
jgi:hypothetical protein